MVPQIKYMQYETRLAKLNLPSLKDRRMRGDLIRCYKFINGFNSMNWFYGGQPETRLNKSQLSVKTRGHQQRLESQFSKLDTRRHFFSNRVVNNWNKLDSTVVSDKSHNSFASVCL